jgi:uncharacterized protein YqhQ
MKQKKNSTVGREACPIRKTSIGGQALMEGIMMRGPKMTAMAVRNTKGEIVIEEFPSSAKKKSVVRIIPVVRGIFNFADSMIFGYKCLMRSAEISGLEEAEEELKKEKEERKAEKKAARNQTSQPEAEPMTNGDSDISTVEESAESLEANQANQQEEHDQLPAEGRAKKDKQSTSVLMWVIMGVSVVLAMALAIGLFVFLPTWIYDTVSRRVDWMAGNRYAKSIFTGVLKILLLVGYMAAISLMKDIRRTFRYHGAEHKTIFCYEKGLPLTVENVRAQRRFHPRCGTSFLILMLLVSILVGFFIPPTLPTWLYTLIRLLLVPLIVGLGYELIKFCGRHDNWLTKIISAPGMALQHITVFEPDDSMIQCAIAAIKEVIPEDGSDKW